MSHKKEIDIYLEVDVLTAGTIAEVINAILETLLYQRNQIPFVYKTFRYYVNKWKGLEEGESSLKEKGYSVSKFQVERKKQQATSTKEAISSMTRTIENIFKVKPIKSIRFLFGSTVSTAKEAYTVHIPIGNIALNHFHEHHGISPSKLNLALLSLLTSENLYDVFSHNLSPTNIYLELELLENDDMISQKEFSQSCKLFPKELLSLPTSCKDIHINLLQKQSSTTSQEHLKCCKELEVFEDLTSLNLKCSSGCSKDSINDKNNKILTTFTSVWWEAEIFIRGFKEQPIKGINIWT